MRLGDFGQPRLEALLDEMLSRGRVSGSLLFDGQPGVGKEALAVELGRVLNCERAAGGGLPCAARAPFTRAMPNAGPASKTAKAAPAKAVKPAARTAKTPVLDVDPGTPAGERCDSCRKFDALQHPDLLMAFPVPTRTWDDSPATITGILRDKAKNPYHKPSDFDRPSGIEADVLRDRVLPAVYSRPVEGRVKVIVVAEAELISRDMGNVLLKTLEEPPANCLLVLTSSTPQRLLPTILSRCQRLRFTPLAPAWMEGRLQHFFGADPLQARLAAAVSQGSMVAAERYIYGDLHAIRDKAVEVLKWAAAGRELELLETAQAFAQEHAKKRYAIPLLLQMLCVAARDAMLLESGAVAPGRPAAAKAGAEMPAGPALANVDLSADLSELAKAYSPDALRAVLRGAERAARQIAGNASVEHTMVAYFLDLSQPASPSAAPAARR